LATASYLIEPSVKIVAGIAPSAGGFLDAVASLPSWRDHNNHSLTVWKPRLLLKLDGFSVDDSV